MVRFDRTSNARDHYFTVVSTMVMAIASSPAALGEVISKYLKNCGPTDTQEFWANMRRAAYTLPYVSPLLIQL